MKGITMEVKYGVKKDNSKRGDCGTTAAAQHLSPLTPRFNSKFNSPFNSQFQLTSRFNSRLKEITN